MAVATPLRPSAAADPNGARIERLNVASARRVIEPDVELAGEVGDGQVLPDELLSVAGLDLDLTREQRILLSREELGSIIDNGLRFEAILMAGFGLTIASSRDLTDPRVVYALHEVGEETRHSRLFSRLLSQVRPTAVNPMTNGRMAPLLKRLERLSVGQITRRPALLFTMVLGGEEIPDLFQKLAGEHEQTDPFVRAVNRYHRQEEARHLAYARTMLPEAWAEAGRVDRALVRHLAPRLIGQMFDFLVHPGVYETVGLDGWATWKAVRVSATRVAIRHEATRPILKVLLDGGILKAGRVPKAWQDLTGTDRHGRPAAA